MLREYIVKHGKRDFDSIVDGTKYEVKSTIGSFRMPDFTATVADAFKRAAANEGSHSVTIKLAFPEEIMETARKKYDQEIKGLEAAYLKNAGKSLKVDWEVFTFR